MMIDKKLLETKYKELIESLNIGIDTAEDELEKLISYFHQHSDQRRKPSEQHGLDIWAFEILGLEKTEYTVDERNVLKQFFLQVENHIIEKSIFELEKRYIDHEEYLKANIVLNKINRIKEKLKNL